MRKNFRLFCSACDKKKSNQKYKFFEIYLRLCKDCCNNADKLMRAYIEMPMYDKALDESGKEENEKS